VGARRYLAIVAGVATLLASLVATFVYLVDPFQVLRRASGVPNFYPVAQYQIPGIARHYARDAVVVGTSTSNNFRTADLASAFGWEAINLSIAGSTIREQQAVLAVALRAGRVRQVFWGVDTFAFAAERGRSFPYYLYGEPGWRTPAYLLSFGAVMHGVATLATPAAARVSLAEWERRSAWDTEYTYGRAQVLTAWAHRATLPRAELPASRASAAEAVAASIARTVAANPLVRFTVVLLPPSILHSKFLLDERPDEFEGGAWVAQEVARQLDAASNARVFDFRDAVDITGDLDAYKDLLHFSGDTSRRILADVAAARHRATPESAATATAAVRDAARRFPSPASPSVPGR
jgi:hypothetical protein